MRRSFRIVTCIRCGRSFRQRPTRKVHEHPLEKIMKQVLPTLCPTCAQKRLLPRRPF